MKTTPQTVLPTPKPDAGSASAKVKQVPQWLTVSVVTFFLAGSGWLIYRQWYSAPATGQDIELKDGDYVPGSPGALARRFAPPPEGVRFNRNHDGATVLAGDVGLHLTISIPSDFAKDFNIYYARGSFATKDQTDLLAAGRRLASDRMAAKYVGLSDDQRTALKAVEWPKLHATGADITRVKKLWRDYTAARGEENRVGAEDAMVAALKEIGAEHLDETKAQAAAQCAKVSAILTSAQLDKFASMGKPGAMPMKKGDLAKADANQPH